MVRVRILSGSHWKDGTKHVRGDTLDVTEKVYKTFSHLMERVPDKAEPEPRIEKITDGVADWVLEEVWADADATNAAKREAIELGLVPDDVVGTGLDGRILVGDVRS